MKRRDFLVTTGLAAAGSSFYFSFDKTISTIFQHDFQSGKLSRPAGKLEMAFYDVIKWMKLNGWTAYLANTLGVNLELTGDNLLSELTKDIDKNKLDALRVKEKSGFDDAAGNKLIRPGFPALSLLYHALASPRVRSADVKAYPSFEHLDALENYIYALSDWDQLKLNYHVASDKDLTLAVFAYEYRPAFKTPHHKCADLVFSRTGVARIGDKPANYSAIDRCYINRPTDSIYAKCVAVTPARYGLFIARKVKSTGLNLLSSNVYKPGDVNDDENDAAKSFLLPIRKVFNHDQLFGESKIEFGEDHRSVKLHNLFTNKKLQTFNGTVPSIRKSDSLIVQEPLRNIGSSFLVISKEAPLIRHAIEKTGGLYFSVPADKKINNRYFNAYSTQEVEEIELLTGAHHSPNKYGQPRNQAMFVNITHKKSDSSAVLIEKLQDIKGNFEGIINKGNYYSPLFEDSICDGSVYVNTSSLNLTKFSELPRQCLPAFSIVTAPDFFPQVDNFDLLDYDVAPGLNKVSNFYEGGTASLASARIRPNPLSIATINDDTIDTYTAVLSAPFNAEPNITAQKLVEFKNPAIDRGYYISGFLPDASSSIFAPGWDVTYAADQRKIYIGTEGLGSPFVEDMKLCAAMNGMWPAASPDAARTYQGSLERKSRNPTAIPLMDNEIGIHKDAPGSKGVNTYGWDGEQGPFLEKVNGVWKVNFTDLGRSDCVQNALDGNLDMSRLRQLTSAQLISRMGCLRMCIQKLPKKNFSSKKNKPQMVGLTYHWLVSAEEVNWGNEDADGCGIPSTLVGNNKDWITKKENAQVQGPGFLFVFVDSRKDGDPRDWADHKRRRLEYDGLFVCQVTESNIAWANITNGFKGWQA